MMGIKKKITTVNIALLYLLSLHLLGGYSANVHMHIHPLLLFGSDRHPGTSYQWIPRKPLDDVMRYSCFSKSDIRGEQCLILS